VSGTGKQITGKKTTGSCICQSIGLRYGISIVPCVRDGFAEHEAICYNLLTSTILHGHPRNWPISLGVHLSRQPAAGCDKSSFGAWPEAARWRHLSRDRPAWRQTAVESFLLSPAVAYINSLKQVLFDRQEQIRINQCTVSQRRRAKPPAFYHRLNFIDYSIIFTYLSHFSKSYTAVHCEIQH